VAAHGRATGARAFPRSIKTTRTGVDGMALSIRVELWLLALSSGTVMTNSTRHRCELVDMKFHSLLKTKLFVMPLWVFLVADKALETPIRAKKGRGWANDAKDILMDDAGK